MLIFLTVFIKRPHYALPFIPLLFVFLMGLLQGNFFPAMAALIFSSICLSAFALTCYISDKKVDTNLLGVDLKTYVSTVFPVLGVQGILLTISWLKIIYAPIPLFKTLPFIGFIFIPNFIALFAGLWALLASLAIRVSKTDAKLNVNTAERLFEDIKNLIAQS